MTWDKSGPRGIPSFRPFNQTLPLDDLPIIVYVSVSCLAHDAAVLAASGAPVLLWAFDLSKAYP